MASARTSDLAFVNFLLSIIRCLVSRTNDDHMANITVNVMNPNREKLNFFFVSLGSFNGLSRNSPARKNAKRCRSSRRTRRTFWLIKRRRRRSRYQHNGSEVTDWPKTILIQSSPQWAQIRLWIWDETGTLISSSPTYLAAFFFNLSAHLSLRHPKWYRKLLRQLPNRSQLHNHPITHYHIELPF